MYSFQRIWDPVSGPTEQHGARVSDLLLGFWQPHPRPSPGPRSLETSLESRLKARGMLLQGGSSSPASPQHPECPLLWCDIYNQLRDKSTPHHTSNAPILFSICTPPCNPGTLHIRK